MPRHGKNGASHNRLAELFARKCRCSGNHNCFEQFEADLNEVSSYVAAFWKFTKLQQDAFVLRLHGQLLFTVSTLVGMLGLVLLLVLCALVGTKLRDVARPADGENHCRQWFLLGKSLGVRCIALILGVGRERLRSACERKMDQRYAQNRLAVQLQLKAWRFDSQAMFLRATSK